MKRQYVVRDLPPYQSDPKVVEELFNRATRSGWTLEWIIPVGGRGMRWAGIFRRSQGADDVWRYLIEQFPRYCSDTSVVEQTLNRRHAEGWELVDVLVMGRNGSHVMGVFRMKWQEWDKKYGESSGREEEVDTGAE